MKRQPLFYLLMCVLLPLFAASCRIEATVDMHMDGTVTTVVEFEDSDGMMQKINQTCEDLRVHFKQAGKFAENAKMEDITVPGGRLRCRSTSNERLGENLKLIDNGKTYSFIYPDSNKGKQEYKGINAHTTIVMPGKIIKTTKGAIKGNKVIIDGLDYLTSGFSIVSEKNGKVSKSTDSSSPIKKAGSSSSSVGLPAWAWAAVGGGALVVIAGLAFVAGRRRGAAKAAARRRQGGMPAGNGYEPSSGGGASPHQQAFGDGAGLDPDGWHRPV